MFLLAICSVPLLSHRESFGLVHSGFKLCCDKNGTSRILCLGLLPRQTSKVHILPHEIMVSTYLIDRLRVLKSRFWFVFQRMLTLAAVKECPFQQASNSFCLETESFLLSGLLQVEPSTSARQAKPDVCTAGVSSDSIYICQICNLNML